MTGPPGIDGIAVVGLSGRWPGARSPEEFWRNLRDGVESISFFTDDELRASGVLPETWCAPNYVRAKGVVDGADLFDARFFGFTPREAELMDPQQRMFLECASDALEDAGHDPERYPGVIGVYAGAGMNMYLLENLEGGRHDPADVFQTTLLNDKDFLTSRVSYKLNLRGPSIAVQTACSTSLVAVSYACHGLWSYHCDVALAGGVSVVPSQHRGYLYQQGGIASADGHCRAFDAAATGTVGGNGAGVIVLKRLADALADGDCIRAVIRGVAVNNDGSAKVGYTAPSVGGQAEVIAMAHALAGLAADDISYVEAHGTATELGDPIEIAALSQAFRASTKRTGFCAIGSVKTNVGHLGAAAGVTGLIKVVLALQHQELPASLHFVRPNPRITFEGSPFYVNATRSPWTMGSRPRRAGVSSFGIGGTNAHVVVEEAPAVEPSRHESRWHVVPVSAKTATALDRAVANLASHLETHPHVDVADLAYTLQVGRRQFARRRTVVCRDVPEALRMLRTERRVALRAGNAGLPRVAFLFPGQGAQYPGMGLELYETEPLFRAEIDRCARWLEQHHGLDLRRLLSLDTSNDTSMAQPALFALEYALARLWIAWGIAPEAMLGHSLGEYVAACISGVFGVEVGLELVTLRGRLMQQLPPGAMVAVPFGAAEAAPLLTDGICVAAQNAPTMSVLSGPVAAVQALEARLASRGIASRRLPATRAFHSSVMDEITARFGDHVAGKKLALPGIPYVSNVTGHWITATEAIDPDYWARHIRAPVQFAKGVSLLAENGDRIFLEVGPGRTLTALTDRQAAATGGAVAVSSLPDPVDRGSESARVLHALGRLWEEGMAVDWPAVYGADRGRRIPLPTYPFERERYWIDRPRAGALERGAVGAAGDGAAAIDECFYVPRWTSAPLPEGAPVNGVGDGGSCWLLLLDDAGIARGLATRLRERRATVITVVPGTGFRHLPGHEYSIDPRRAEDYRSLCETLRSQGMVPRTIVHAWSVSRAAAVTDETNFMSLLLLMQALEQGDVAGSLQVTIVTSGAQQVSGTDLVRPDQALVLGPATVIPQEYPRTACRVIDIPAPDPDADAPVALIDALFSEVVSSAVDPVVAYRGTTRLVRALTRISLPATTGAPSLLRARGVYLITGGFGGVGHALAEYLARTVQARLVLVGRSPMPPRASWDAVERNGPDADGAVRRIHQVRSLEAMGAEVMAVSADVTDADQMHGVVDDVFRRFGEIHGIVHAAGVAGGGAIALKTSAAAARVLAPKVQGTRVLDSIADGRHLDFFVVCSSLASLLGGFGQADYCAANAFLDAFAQRPTRGVPVISINWDTWREVGMAVDTAVPSDLRAARAANLSAGLSTVEAVAAFDRILRQRMPQIVVAKRDPRARTRLPAAGGNLEAPTRLAPTRHARPALDVPYVLARTRTEEALAEIWAEVLGLDRVGAHDKFFDLGGHSLSALQVIAKFEAAAGLRLQLPEFAFLTLGQLAAASDERLAARTPPRPSLRQTVARVARSIFEPRRDTPVGRDPR